MSGEEASSAPPSGVDANLFSRNRHETSPPQASRRTSCSSNASSSSLSCATPDYDSGHYSGSNASEFVFQPGISCSSEEDASTEQELRTIRSELERLAKSERWYKNELKVQKRSKLDLLEKLYTNERKFMRENQKLQSDCKRLYSLCSEIERKKSEEKEELAKQVKDLENQLKSSKSKSHVNQPDVEGLHFQLQQQRAVAQENEHLIQTLRAQKQNLLDELRLLTHDRDAKLLEIEKKTLALECENRTITKRCLDLVKNKAQLEQQLSTSLQGNDEVVTLRQTTQRQVAEIGRLAGSLSDHKTASSIEINHLKNQLGAANSKIQKFNEELGELKASCAEQTLRNEHLEAEVEQYKKMREHFDKYVALLQGNSAELDSKCMEVEHLRSLVEVQTNQVAELNKTTETTKAYWQKITDDLRKQLEVKSKEIVSKEQQHVDIDLRRSSEIRKLRERLSQLEGLNEKLLSQLRNSSTEISKKSTEIEQLKATARELGELSLENTQLRKLLDVKDEELCQKKVHEAFISELQSEIQTLKEKLKVEMCKTSEFDSMTLRNKEFEKVVERMKEDNVSLREKLDSYKKERDVLQSSFRIQLQEMKNSNDNLKARNKELELSAELQNNKINFLQLENDQLKTQLAEHREIQPQQQCCHECVKQYESSRLSPSHPDALVEVVPTSNDESYSQKDMCETVFDANEHRQIPLLREASQKVPEICDRACQVDALQLPKQSRCRCNAASGEQSSASAVRELKLMQRVIDAEHRKHISRYELHIRTLLGKLRSYKNREAKKKSREVLECEREIASLREKLRLALRHCSEINHYKRVNLQLTSNLQSLTDDYKKILLTTPRSNQIPVGGTKHNYDELYRLIEDSNNFVPNFNQLNDSIDGLQHDISRLRLSVGPPLAACSTPGKIYLNPAKRLSLMDELKAAEDSFNF